MENICDLISQKRKERGMTQMELGAMLGISLLFIYSSVYKKVRPMKERTEKVFLHCCHTISRQC